MKTTHLQSQVAGHRSIEGAVKIKLLGQLVLSVDDDEVRVSARKDLALLAYLANTPGQSQRRSQLAALLWPASDDSRARESLKQSLLRLRKILPDNTFSSDRHTATLLVNRQQVDITYLEDLLATESVEDIASATALLSDNFLGELECLSEDFERWRQTRYRQLLDLGRNTALRALKQSISQNNIEQAEMLGEQLLAMDPVDEEVTRYLIAGYHAKGRARKALRLFDDLKARLRDDIGVEPEEATVSLIETVSAVSEDTEPTQQADVPRIAILPFRVSGDDRSQRYFAEGLTDDITTDLARNKTLEVLPASAFSGLQDDISTVVKARGAQFVLSGSVRRSDNTLRINTRLSSVGDNQIVWAQRFDRDLSDVFNMQDAISSQIVMRLHQELKSEIVPVSDHGTHNAQAYDMFHKGRSLYLRGINNHSLRAAKALLDRSIKLDPTFARAYAQLAICESYLAMSIVNKTGEDCSDKVIVHGKKALQLSPELALGHAAVGLSHYASGNYEDAELALQKAIELDQNLFEAQFFLARNRQLVGDYEGAVIRFRTAAGLRPDDYRSSGLLGDALKALGRMDEAKEAFSMAIERIDAELERHPENAGALAFGAPILVDLDRYAQARNWCVWALAIEPQDSLLRYNLARHSAVLGEPEQALEHLEVAFEAPYVVQRRLALWMRYDEDFKPLATHSRFVNLLEYACRTR